MVLMPVAGLAITTQGAEPIEAMWVRSVTGGEGRQGEGGGTTGSETKNVTAGRAGSRA